jgi:hypothetical protein
VRSFDGWAEPVLSAESLDERNGPTRRELRQNVIEQARCDLAAENHLPWRFPRGKTYDEALGWLRRDAKIMGGYFGVEPDAFYVNRARPRGRQESATRVGDGSRQLFEQGAGQLTANGFAA